MAKLDNKIAIVTGAARGLGKGIAHKLAEKGAKPVIVDLDEQACKDAVEEITADGYEATYYVANIANKDEVEALFEHVVEEEGTVDIMVNNAGINRDVTIHNMTMEQWDEVIAVNLTGTFLCTQQAARLMREKREGRIINISSASWEGNFGQANYAASKAGVIGLTKTAARELARRNVTCNAICPGFIDTDMTRGVPENVWDQMISKIPLGRAGTSEDVGNMVAFLASDEASYITNEVINVGGGMIL